VDGNGQLASLHDKQFLDAGQLRAASLARRQQIGGYFQRFQVERTAF
jgi:hypothetical protein